MSAPLRHPVNPAGVVRRETAPRINSTVPCALHGAECNWPACDPSCAGRPGNPKPEVVYLDLDIPDGDYLGADPLTVFRANYERKRLDDAKYDNRGDRLLMALEGD